MFQFFGATTMPGIPIERLVLQLGFEGRSKEEGKHFV